MPLGFGRIWRGKTWTTRLPPCPAPESKYGILGARSRASVAEKLAFGAFRRRSRKIEQWNGSCMSTDTDKPRLTLLKPIYHDRGWCTRSNILPVRVKDAVDLPDGLVSSTSSIAICCTLRRGSRRRRLWRLRCPSRRGGPRDRCVRSWRSGCN